jgi:hypothetical protein
VTAVGPVRVERWHSRCAFCGDVGFAADALLGLSGWLTDRARRMAVRAGLNDPFRQAEALLAELAGWSVDAETLRRYTHAEASDVAAARAGRTALPKAFAQAPGEHEVHLDAGKVNTPEGWRDVKVAVFACRERAAPADSDDYTQRGLPKPSVRSVIAAVEEVGVFSRRCLWEARRLGLADSERLSVLGDGADWVWAIAARQFPQAAQLLDIYHAAEHLAEVGRAVVGEGAELAEWLGPARRRLIGDGYDGVCEVLAQPVDDAAARRRVAGVAGAVLNYFAAHRGRLGYAGRLRRGQTIGSGLVEGTIKELVNLRIKRTGARWLADHVGPFVELLALTQSPEWQEHWTKLAA